MRVFAVLLSGALLAGCGSGEFADLQEFVKTAGADMRGKVDPLPEIKPYEPFTYDNTAGLPDPFKPRKPELRKGGKRGLNEPDFDRPREALEEFPLDSLKMVGYLKRGGVPYGVVRAPDGKLYHVKAGNYIGQNFGLIREIGETEMKIKEVVQDSAGDWSERMSTLTMME